MIPVTVTQKIAKIGFLAKKHSPEILLVVGIAAVVGGTILACKATLKAKDIVDKYNGDLDAIDHATETAEMDSTVVYTNGDREKDTNIAKVQTAVGLLKAYAIPTILVVAGVTCLVSSHKILKGRQLAILAAYKSLEELLSVYRKRVKEEIGEDKENECFIGAKNIGSKIFNVKNAETGEEETQNCNTYDLSNVGGIYHRIFDANNPRWSSFPGYNATFCKCVENTANNELRMKGFVILGDVLDKLGYKRTPESLITGWRLNAETGDGFVDFGLEKEINRAAMKAGQDHEIVLEFNIDGTIWDKI